MSHDDDRYTRHQAGQAAIVHPDVIERDRRCANCLSFRNDELAIKHYKQRCFGDMQRRALEILERDGVLPAQLDHKRLDNTDPDQAMAALGLNYDYGDQLIRQNLLGICLRGATDSDFVHAHYLCEKWEQRYRPDRIDEGHKDETSEEARARLGREDA